MERRREPAIENQCDGILLRVDLTEMTVKHPPQGDFVLCGVIFQKEFCRRQERAQVTVALIEAVGSLRLNQSCGRGVGGRRDAGRTSGFLH